MATDVTEINTGQGTVLFVDDKHQYADLDELIVNHVQATARKVEELMAHEKFKQGSEDELREYLCLTFSSRFTPCCRSILEEFCRSQPREKYLWIHAEPQKTWSF